MSANSRVKNVLGHLKPGADVVNIVSTAGGVAVIQINYPPVNSFNPLTQQGLAKCYNAALNDASVKAIVVTGAGNFFMAGADIGYMAKQRLKWTREQMVEFAKTGNDLMNKMESGPKPVVAAVNGPALGGGCELAMACNARVALKTVKMGLPELQLGLIPGLGGTQRLPRLIGVKAAVAATLSSKPLNAKKALKAGLIDAIAKKPADLIATASKIALDIASGKLPRRRSLYLNDKINRNKRVEYLTIEGARLKAAARAKGAPVPHPDAFLNACWTGVEQGGEKGLQKEHEGFADCLSSEVAGSLIHMFFSSKDTSKIPGVDIKGAKKVKTVGVLGAGTMGAGIIIVLLMKGYNVILKEHNQHYLEIGVNRIVSTIARFLKKKKMPAMGIEMMMRGLTPQITYDNFDKCDVVIEAVIENIPLKQKIFKELEQVCNKDCVLATNTSTIDINLVAKDVKCKDRVLGLHFFSPAHIMPLLEIIRTENTSAATLARTVALAKKIGKTPVVVGNCVGFTANRMFFPYGQGAGLLVDGGVNPYQIDKALEKWGMPMGVFKMSDLSGVDIASHVGGIINSAYGDRCYNSTLTSKLMEAKRLGQKTGQGYYVYKKNRPVKDPAGIAGFLAAARADSKMAPLGKLSDKDIVEMVLYPVVNESYRILDEGHVLRASDIDVTSIMGYGFPAWRGGAMRWASQEGLAYVRDRLDYFSRTYGKGNPAVAAFYRPCARLVKEASK